MSKELMILREIEKLADIYFIELNERRAAVCIELLKDREIKQIQRAIELYVADSDNTKFPIPITRIFAQNISKDEYECSDAAWKLYREKVKNYKGVADIIHAKHTLLQSAINETK